MKQKIRKHIDRIFPASSTAKPFNPIEIAKSLTKLHEYDIGLFFSNLGKLPIVQLADVLLELPAQEFASALTRLPHHKLAQAASALESNESTDLIQRIRTVDETLTGKVLALMSPQDRNDIVELSKYEEEQAGAYMEREFLAAHIDETVEKVKERIRIFRREEPASPIIKLFVIDDAGKLISSLHFTDLILYDDHVTLRYILDKLGRRPPLTIRPTSPILEVVRLFEEYDLNIIAVVNKSGKLIGRIVYDDIYDIIRQLDTEQAYNLAGVDDEAEEGSIKQAARQRLIWLFVNLGTILLASYVIDIFDEAIASYVALAVLLPVIAALGGNAGMQALTVTIRKLALNEIDFANASGVLRREALIILGNGAAIAAATGLVAFIWFHSPVLSLIAATSIFLNLFIAGTAGTLIPLGLRKLGVDPAIASSVFLTTTTDAFGFFIFLFLAQTFLL